MISVDFLWGGNRVAPGPRLEAPLVQWLTLPVIQGPLGSQTKHFLKNLVPNDSPNLLSSWLHFSINSWTQKRLQKELCGTSYSPLTQQPGCCHVTDDLRVMCFLLSSSHSCQLTGEATEARTPLKELPQRAPTKSSHNVPTDLWTQMRRVWDRTEPVGNHHVGESDWSSSLFWNSPDLSSTLVIQRLGADLKFCTCQLPIWYNMNMILTILSLPMKKIFHAKFCM